MVANYYIKQVKSEKGTAYQYEIISPEEFKNLRNKVSNVLNENVERLNGLRSESSNSAMEFISPVVVQKKNEPVKRKKAS